jgi:predicted DNA-binding transcriptional regulator YafY
MLGVVVAEPVIDEPARLGVGVVGQEELRKIRIRYVDESGNRTQRTIWPIAMAYYVDVTLIAAWCELRNDYRHFRVERIQSSEFLEDKFPADNGRLLARWLALQNARSDASEAWPAGTSAA